MWDLSRLPESADGTGVVVAVLDSGVDDGHPQLVGQVTAERDELRNGTTPKDCVGHGTAVASIIAAKPISGVRFRGIAPGATIISDRVTEKLGGGGDKMDQATFAEMAGAIDWAVRGGAKVINMSFSYTSVDQDRLRPVRDAVAAAIAKDVVVIAAVGNGKKDGNLRPYPAAWDGVLGVGAVSETGQRLEESQTGDYVDLTAPGTDVTFAWPGGGHFKMSGTSFAAPMVAGTAALVRQMYPKLTEAQVRQRLMATADPAPGGRRSDGYGVGVVNPVRAVTEVIDGMGPAGAQSLSPARIDPRTVAAQAREATRHRQALWFGGLGIIVTGLVIALNAALPRGARRRWRPAGR